MNDFFIPSAAGSGGLFFYARSPDDLTKPIESFWIRVTDHNLSAVGQVYATYASSHPASLFAEMAKQWAGWSDELIWKSLDGELTLRCSHDRRGHISIQIELSSAPMPYDWRVVVTVMAEAGQLENIARHAAKFVGCAECKN